MAAPRAERFKFNPPSFRELLARRKSVRRDSQQFELVDDFFHRGDGQAARGVVAEKQAEASQQGNDENKSPQSGRVTGRKRAASDIAVSPSLRSGKQARRSSSTEAVAEPDDFQAPEDTAELAEQLVEDSPGLFTSPVPAPPSVRGSVTRLPDASSDPTPRKSILASAASSSRKRKSVAFAAPSPSVPEPSPVHPKRLFDPSGATSMPPSADAVRVEADRGSDDDGSIDDNVAGHEDDDDDHEDDGSRGDLDDEEDRVAEAAVPSLSAKKPVRTHRGGKTTAAGKRGKGKRTGGSDRGKKDASAAEVPSEAQIQTWDEVRAQRKPDTPGVRRTGRTRVRPLAFWRNETIVYERRDAALPTPAEVVRQPYASPGPRRTRRPRAADLAVVAEFRHRTVDGREASSELAITDNMLMYTDFDRHAKRVGDEGKHGKKKAAFSVASAFEQEEWRSGMMKLAPRECKPLQNSRHMAIACCVVKGRVELTLNDQSVELGKAAQFWIPPHNSYALRNMAGAAAQISFVCVEEFDAAGDDAS